jgi:serine/threonine-protein kinase
VKTLRWDTNIRYFEREKSVHEGLNHPLIVGFAEYRPPTEKRAAEIVSEFVQNGSLAEPFSSSQGEGGEGDLSRLVGGTRITIIVAGIVLAMRYLHWRRIIHRGLKPANILIDWDWNVRIGDFTHSLIADACGDALSDEIASLTEDPSIELRYTAPESIDNRPSVKSDVFSFGVILFEMLSGEPMFSPDTPPQRVMAELAFRTSKHRPAIGEFVWPAAAELICDCCEQNPIDRPSVDQILTRLGEMDYQIMAGVRSAKVREFVAAVKRRERSLGIDIDDPE